MSMLYCPRCESEYLASVTMCASCDVELVPDLSAAVREADQMPPVSQLECVRAASIGWAQGLSDHLAEAGISHRIQAVGDDDDDESLREQPNALLPYGVWVLPADLERARAIDDEYLRGQIPDLPGAGPDRSGIDASRPPPVSSATSTDGSSPNACCSSGLGCAPHARIRPASASHAASQRTRRKVARQRSRSARKRSCASRLAATRSISR